MELAHRGPPFRLRSCLASAVAGVACGVLVAPGALADPLNTPNLPMTFSIDLQGPTIGLPDSFSGIPIDEGSILTPFPPGPPGPNPAVPGPLPPPGMMVHSMPSR